MEIKSAQSRAFSSNDEYILPVIMEDVEVPGLDSTIGHVDGRKLSPKKLAELTFKKVKKIK